MTHSPLAWMISALACGLSTAAYAQAKSDAVELPVQVSSATGFRQQALLAPMAVTVLERADIDSKPSADLAEVLRDLPGVAIVDSGFPGMKRLSLRGESARRVLVKVNGQPLADHSNYGTPLLIDVAMIERIEIVRGSASVVHGSNAIGGVVNIITRQALEGESLFLAGAGYYSATEGYKISLGTLGSSDQLDWRLQASQTEHQDRRIPHQRLDNSNANDQSLSVELGWRVGQSRLAWQGDYFDQAANAWSDPAKGLDYMGMPERSSLRNALSYEFVGNGKIEKIHAQLYHHSGTRILDNGVTATTPMLTVNSKNRSDDDLNTSGAQLNMQSRILGDNISVLGLEYQLDTLNTDKAGITTTKLASAPAPTVRHSRSNQEAEQSFWSAFLQQQWRLAAGLEAHFGMRYYDITAQLEQSSERSPAEDSEGRWVGSAALVWQLNEQASLRASFAQGYTYPSLTQQFAVTAGGSDIHFGNPELKSETATTYELGARVEGRAWTLDATVYHSQADNFIDRKSISQAPVGYGNYSVPSSKQKFWQWVNVSQAHSLGFELMLAYQFEALRPYTNLSLQERELTFANGYQTKASGLPNYMARLGLIWDLTPELNLDAFMRSYGDAKRRDQQGAVETNSDTQDYLTYHLNAQYQITPQLSLSMALHNLTNKRYQNPDELPGIERSVDVEMHWQF